MSNYLICRQCGGHDIRPGWHDRHTMTLECPACGNIGYLTGYVTCEGDSIGEAYQRANLPGKGMLA